MSARSQSDEESDSDSGDSEDSDVEELPYGGDMQQAIQAQDREAIRALMDARKQGGASKVRTCI